MESLNFPTGAKKNLQMKKAKTLEQMRSAQTAQFVQYVLHFYGKNGLRPFNCEDDLIMSVAKFYAETEYDFENDTTDRERVHRMLIALGCRQIDYSSKHPFERLTK